MAEFIVRRLGMILDLEGLAEAREAYVKVFTKERNLRFKEGTDQKLIERGGDFKEVIVEIEANK